MEQSAERQERITILTGALDELEEQKDELVTLTRKMPIEINIGNEDVFSYRAVFANGAEYRKLLGIIREEIGLLTSGKGTLRKNVNLFYM